jgi:hypothetical protein
MLYLSRLSIALVLVLVLNACQKENAKTKTELLTQKPWIIKKLELKEGSAPWEDLYFLLEPCSQDDRFIFYTNNTFEVNEGPTKCDPSDPQVFKTGDWYFTNNDTKLKLDVDEEYLIETLNENELVLSAQETINGSLRQTRLTLRHP